MIHENPTAEEALNAGKTLQIKPLGTSMFPLIKEGRDSVYIKKTSFEHTKYGDIVLYRNENHLLVLHRLCKKTSDTFYTVGDNQLLSAGPYPKGNLLGKMVAMNRNGRYMDTSQKILRMYGRLWLIRRRVLLMIRMAVKTIRDISSTIYRAHF